jgi:hypothetical protein
MSTAARVGSAKRTPDHLEMGEIGSVLFGEFSIVPEMGENRSEDAQELFAGFDEPEIVSLEDVRNLRHSIFLRLTSE